MKMGTHWTDKRTARVLVARELERRGWTLYGFSEDKSDAMTDYYDPASWVGVAEHTSGAVACVDVSKHEVGYSGGRERVRWAEGKQETFVEPWPTFQANPKGASWHVERGGRILAQGTGVFSVVECNSHMEPYKSLQAAKLEKLVGRIERAVLAREIADDPTPAQIAGEGITVRLSSTGRAGFVEVHFAQKPPEGLRAELKAAGFRWAKLTRSWYGPSAKLPTRYGEPPAEPGQGHAPDIDIAAGY
jgi:hypothetical protein